MLVAQLDRALDSDSKGQRFESSRARHKQQHPFEGVVVCDLILGIRREGLANVPVALLPRPGLKTANTYIKRKDADREKRLSTNPPGHATNNNTPSRVLLFVI